MIDNGWRESALLAMTPDPCPQAATELLDAMAAGWLEIEDDLLAELGEARSFVEPWRMTDKALLTELRMAQHERSRTESRWFALLAEAERRQATFHRTGLPTSSWLTDQNTHAARSARDEVRLATLLEGQPLVAAALEGGALSPEQAKVIAHGLSRLPDGLDAAAREQVEAELVRLGERFGPYGLARLVNRTVEVVAPEVADDADRRAVERVEAEQRRDRFLTWRKDEDGALVFRGKLGKLAGEQLTGVLQAMAASQRKSAALAGEKLSKAQANADALVSLVDHFSSCGAPARFGADRPRVLVSLDYPTLCGQLGQATLLNSGESITAAEARRLACDAEIIPAVLGAESVPLDVGRVRRLFTGHLRTLLIARDRGCAFPGCDRAPAECEGHHRRPWWQGGETSLANGVLLCGHHHHLVEPDPNRPAEQQWLIRLDSRGHAEFGAPEGRGAPPGERRWRQHHRYQLRC